MSAAPKTDREKSLSLDFAMWLQRCFDEILDEATREQLIAEAHAHAAIERELPVNSAKRKAFFLLRTEEEL